jgi:nucleoside-diphosphate-sugar epimerase
MTPQSTAQMKTVSLLGCGWLGIALAHSFLGRDWFVRGSTTHPSRVTSLSSIGIEPLLLRIDPSEQNEFTSSPGSEKFFSSHCLVINIPPETALGADYHPAQLKAILAMIDQSPVKPAQILYVSSTSVYGSTQGNVNEETEPLPDQGSGSILLAAEKLLTEYAIAKKVGLTIVRPGGLIGPGRHPGLFLAGRRGALNGEAPVNMIHQLDLSELLTSLVVDHSTAAGSTTIFNAVSSHHPKRSEFYPRAALAIGVAPPIFAEAKSPNAKVVSSEKIRAVTGLALRFDDLYAAIGAV